MCHSDDEKIIIGLDVCGRVKGIGGEVISCHVPLWTKNIVYIISQHLTSSMPTHPLRHCLLRPRLPSNSTFFIIVATPVSSLSHSWVAVTMDAGQGYDVCCSGNGKKFWYVSQQSWRLTWERGCTKRLIIVLIIIGAMLVLVGKWCRFSHYLTILLYQALSDVISSCGVNISLEG